MIPKVSSEIVTSIREQVERGRRFDDWGNNYVEGIIQKVNNENLVLWRSVMDTAEELAGNIVNKFEEQISGGVNEDLSRDFNREVEIDPVIAGNIAIQYMKSEIFNGMCVLMLVIYQAIEQQMIIDELE